MAPRIHLDPVPQPVAGVMTTKCECGWEAVFIMPEEQVIVIASIFQHLKDGHKLDFPQICCFWH